ncbi:UNVERIFIED_CONTAM: hypothetical protein GTU68_059385, partial [Idotea baltica]|nr:hypothetical protein [Idotea baltica]
AVVSAEFVKFFASLYLVFYQAGSLQQCLFTLHNQIWKQKLDTLKVAIPSLIYLIQNNLLYVSASNLDAATYQVTYQMKILTTAMFAVAILGKKLRPLQWAALFLLTVGVALVQLSNTDAGGGEGGLEQNRLLGCIAAISACCCSGFAGIYFEKILKGSDVSIWVRNVQLSFLSLPLGLVTSLANDGSSISEKGFFFGYDAYIVYLVVLNAVGGLLVAMVVKYADNILKGFATWPIVLVQPSLDVYFNFVLTFQFALGRFVMASIFPTRTTPKGAVSTQVEKGR